MKTNLKIIAFCISYIWLFAAWIYVSSPENIPLSKLLRYAAYNSIGGTLFLLIFFYLVDVKILGKYRRNKTLKGIVHHNAKFALPMDEETKHPVKTLLVDNRNVPVIISVIVPEDMTVGYACFSTRERVYYYRRKENEYIIFDPAMDARVEKMTGCPFHFEDNGIHW